MAMVADASVTVAWFVKGQATADTERLLDRVTRETLHVPPLWLPEFVNALITLGRGREQFPIIVGGRCGSERFKDEIEAALKRAARRPKRGRPATSQAKT